MKDEYFKHLKINVEFETDKRKGDKCFSWDLNKKSNKDIGDIFPTINISMDYLNELPYIIFDWERKNAKI